MKPRELERIAQLGLEAARVLLWGAAILALALVFAWLFACDAEEPDTCGAWLDCYERCRIEGGTACDCGDATGLRKVVVDADAWLLEELNGTCYRGLDAYQATVDARAFCRED